MSTRRNFIKLGALTGATALTDAHAMALDDTPIVAAQAYGAPPKDAIVLFDGKDTSPWVHVNDRRPCEWIVKDDGSMQVNKGSIMTKQEFTDFQLHVEFWMPKLPDNVKSQSRANSGVYMQGRYEIQILDMVNNETYAKGGGGAIYEVKDPDVLACLPPEHWQTYDVYFHAPKFDDSGNKTANARMTALWNSVFIHEAVEVPGHTRAAMMTDPKLPGPIMLQDHGGSVRFRNIWIRPVK